MGGFGGIIWFLLIGAFFLWMMKKGGCGGGHKHGDEGGHSHGDEGGHSHGDGDGHNHGKSDKEEPVAIAEKSKLDGPEKKKGCH